ncbi:MAG: HpcH/HpaI aldolase family protein [Bacteroidales bacterium]
MRNFRQKLLGQEIMTGTLVTLSSTETAEILSRAGFDWLFIDLEHSPIGLQGAQQIIQAASPFAHCIVRVPGNDEIWIKRVLDIGAEGIIVPQVNTVQEAQQAVKFAKYPPMGQRSAGIAKAQGYGAELHQYIQQANEDIAVILQCEHKESVKNLSEIIKVEGVDCIFIGPYDLSGSYGKLGKVDDPQIQEAIESIKHTCINSGMPVGIFGGKTESVKKHRSKEVNLIAVGSDALMMNTTAKDVIDDLKF